MIRIIRTEMKRALGWTWIISILGVVFCICFDSWNDLIIELENKTGYVHYFFWNSAFGGMCRGYLIPVFATIPFAGSLCHERSCNVQPFIMSRQGRKGYSVSKFVVNAMSGGFVVALGTVLLLLGLRLVFPMTSSDYNDAEITTVFHMWEAMHYPIRYCVMETIFGFCRGMIWSSIALLVSVYTNDIFVVTLSPYFIRYMIVEICKTLKIKDEYRIDMLLIGRVVLKSSPYTLLVGCVCTVIVIILVGGIFVWKLSKR